MAKLVITNSLRSKIFAALVAAGIAAPSAYVASDLTVSSEGFLTHLHNDPVGKPTSCIGHLIKPGETALKSYDEDTCIAIFVKDWVEHEKLLDSVVKVPYRSEWMKGAITDFTFNKGIGNVKSSTLLKNLNAGNYDAACVELTRWIYGTVDGKKVVLRGLDIRAKAQYKYCMGEEPSEYKTKMQEYTGGSYVKPVIQKHL